MKTEVIIIGAGLTGLTLSYHLQQHKISFKIIEARNQIGGRIRTINSQNHTPIEMGATWFTKQHNDLITLLNELQINVFEQYMEGTALFEPLSTAPPQQFHIPKNQESSYRIAGGSYKLIEELYNTVDQQNIILNEAISHIEKTNFETITLHSKENKYECKKVVSTIPPSLLASSITFSPSLPDDLIDTIAKTHTWMGDSIKFGVSYQRPFWKEEGYSGTLFSSVGPISELYDHSNASNNKFALKGFLQNSLSTYSKEQRKDKVLSQLQKVFGTKATDYLAYEETVWSKEKYTYSESDSFIFPHQNNGHPLFQKPYLDNTLFIGGTETSKQFGGYMEGAVQSALSIYKQILESL